MSAREIAITTVTAQFGISRQSAMAIIIYAILSLRDRTNDFSTPSMIRRVRFHILRHYKALFRAIEEGRTSNYASCFVSRPPPDVVVEPVVIVDLTQT